MSDDRRKYTPKLFLLTDEQVAFILDEAQRRDPRRYNSPGATRAQSGVARDLVEFARKYHSLFLTFVATDSQNTTDGDVKHNNAAPGS